MFTAKLLFPGIKVVFRCGLVILKITLGKPEIPQQLPGLYETLDYLKKFDLKEMEPESLINQVCTYTLKQLPCFHVPCSVLAFYVFST